MSTWFDTVSAIFTFTLFFGAIGGAIYIAKAVNGAVHTTKESMKANGMDYKDGQFSVKTDKTFDRERYLDATQRAIVNSAGAVSMGSKSQVAVDDADRERMERERLSDEAKKQKKYRIPGLLARKSKPKSESSL